MKKALKWILIIFLILLVGLIALVACFGGSSTDEETSAANEAMADMTPQQIDLEMYRPVRSAKASYEKLVEMIGQLESGESSNIEIYDYCQQVLDWYPGWGDTIESMTNDDTAAYADAADGYVGNVMLIAKDTADFINEQDYDKITSVREGLQLMPAYENDLVEARTAYLSNAGLTDEEIQQQFDLG